MAFIRSQEKRQPNLRLTSQTRYCRSCRERLRIPWPCKAVVIWVRRLFRSWIWTVLSTQRCWTRNWDCRCKAWQRLRGKGLRHQFQALCPLMSLPYSSLSSRRGGRWRTDSGKKWRPSCSAASCTKIINIRRIAWSPKESGISCSISSINRKCSSISKPFRIKCRMILATYNRYLPQ